MPNALPPLTGQRFGSLLVLDEGPRVTTADGRRPTRQWHCRCDCGTTRLVRQPNLTNGHTRSCGCIKAPAPSQRTHGLSESDTYKCWRSMKRRCHDPSSNSFQRYGGRGIVVCEQWRHSFEAFLADMGERPSPLHTLDRKDNDGNYEPGNVRWATSKEQAINRSSNHLLTFAGESLPISEWSKRLGIPHPTITTRLRLGWPIERVLTPPRRDSPASESL